jgi:diamine N-acetyltransferase
MDLELKIEKIGVDEIGTIVHLANEIWPVTYKEILPVDQINYMMELFYSPASLKMQMNEKRHQFILARIKDKPAAFSSYAATGEPGVYKLHKIYVHPAVQGQGVGKSMIDYIIHDLENYKATTLELNVNRNNAAKHFYEKLGFYLVGEEDINIGNGYYMNDYVMRKPVE